MLMMTASLESIRNGINELDQFNSTKGQGTTRILFTDVELEAREYIKDKMKEIGLTVEEDAVGNIFGVLKGQEPELPPIWSGSHIDTVKHAGKFDGMAGVIAAIEAQRMIQESGRKHKRTIKSVVFTSEEPTRFGLCCLGSRALAGELKREDLSEIRDADGESLEQVLVRLGYDLNAFHLIRKRNQDVYASVELHIEQGAVLEQAGKSIGIVEAIAGPSNITVTVEGVQEHAGSTPMPIRVDALTAAAEIVLKVEALAKGSSSEHTVGTVGFMEVYPNASNAIPGKVTFTIDLRDSEMEVKEKVMQELLSYFKELESSRQVRIYYNIDNHDKPMPCNKNINHMIEKICSEKSIDYTRMISGAYHDSMFVGKFAPISMIFVPSRGGLSHNPDEWTDFEDIKTGTELLAESLLRLANK